MTTSVRFWSFYHHLWLFFGEKEPAGTQENAFFSIHIHPAESAPSMAPIMVIFGRIFVHLWPTLRLFAQQSHFLAFRSALPSAATEAAALSTTLRCLVESNDTLFGAFLIRNIRNGPFWRVFEVF
jgi:hypothetical protein